MSTVLLIIAVVLVALSPLLHFVPTKRQQRQARLREAAALSGLFVEFRSLPGTDTDRQRARSAQDIIYYGRRLPPSRGRSQRDMCWLKRDGQWFDMTRAFQPLPLPLQALEAHILAASADDNSCGIYWSEPAETLTAEEISQAIAAWSASFSS